MNYCQIEVSGENRVVTHRTPTVCVLAYDGLCTFEFGIGIEMFGLQRPEFDLWYDCKVVSIEPGPLHAQGGLVINVTHNLSKLAEADLIVIPGWRGVDEPVPSKLVRALLDAHGRGTRIASFCSGAFVLAATGLLDRSATTHWRYADALKERFPSVQFEPDVLYVDGGDVLTSAGSAAAVDLCFHIIRKDFGTKKANAVARRLVVPAQRQGGQRQFVEAPPTKQRTGGIAPLLERIRSHLDEEWSLARMAEVAGLSTRTLARRFRESTANTPLGWLKNERVIRACELLEDPGLPIIDIAEACGFRSIETFRQVFRQQRGISPTQHRNSFSDR